MSKKFQVISQGDSVPTPTDENEPVDTSKLSNAELIIDFMRSQVKEMEEYHARGEEIPLQKAILIYCFGHTNDFEEAASGFQFISIDMHTPDFFLLVEKMKQDYLRNLD